MLQIILAFLALSIFLILQFFVGDNPNRLFVKSILLTYPVLAIDIAPGFVSTSVFVFISAIFFLFFQRKKQFSFPGSRKYEAMTFLLFGTLGLGLLFGKDLSVESLSSSMEILSIFLFSKTLITECIEDSKFSSEVISYLQISLLLSLVFVGAQLVFGPEVTIAKSQNINVTGGQNVRYPSYFQDPQKYAQFLAAVSFLFLAPSNKGLFKLPVGYFFMLAALTALFLTGGRSATGGWLLGIFILMLFSNPAFRISGLVLAAFILIIFYHYGHHFALFQRNSTLEDAYDFRYAIWLDAWKIFLENKLLGIGIGNYANYVAVHNPDQFWIADNEITFFDHPESGYLKLLTEFGIVGFVVYMTFIIIPVFQSVSVYLKNKQIKHLIPAAAVLSWLVGFYTVYSLGDIRIYILIATALSLLISEHALHAKQTVFQHS